MIKEFISNLIRQKTQTANVVLIMLVFTLCTTYSIVFFVGVVRHEQSVLETLNSQAISFKEIIILVLGYVLAKRNTDDGK
jgi:hypothetical protein